MTTNTKTLYDRIGGRPAVAAVVDEFYRRVLADPLLAPKFRDTDMPRQRAHQVAFLTHVLGAADGHSGRDLRTAHAGRGITSEHFARVAGHLQGTLQAAGVKAPELGEILTAVASLEDTIVGH